jgi:hypothetical protein
MLLFTFALVVVAAAVGVFAHYNPQTMDITVRTYHLTGVPIWEVVAAAAGVPFVPYLMRVLYSGARIRGLRRVRSRYTTGRTLNDLPSAVEPQPAPKRSWSGSSD